MPVLGEQLDYTDKDFASLRLRLHNLISSVFPTWTQTDIANFGNLLVEMYAFVGGVLTKYQDNQAIESRWSVATQRKNLIAMAKLIGYEPPTATASQVDVTISIGSPAAGDVVFPAGTVVRTRNVADPVTFRLISDVTIPAGATSASGTAEDADPQEESFASAGTPNLEIRLGRVPYLDGSAVVVAANGAFTEVDNFLETTGTDRHFTLTVDQNDRATLRFGDGVIGIIPTGSIVVSYKTGGGSAGVVEAETVRVIEGSFTDSFGTAVVASVTNPAASSPASDRASVEEIREEAPLSLRVLTRTVTREDFEINALRVPGVARALMLTSDEDAAIAENSGYLFIVPDGGGVPTAALLDAVETMVTVTYPHTLTFSLIVAQALYKTVDVTAKVWVRKGYTAAAARAAIEAALASFFAVRNADGTLNTAIGWGFEFVEEDGDPVGLLPLSDVFNVVRDVAAVRKIGDASADFTLNGAHADLSVLLREWPVLGTVTLINGETGGPL